jgi:MFS family permease
MQTMAQAWLVYRLTGSPFLLGLVEFLSRAPILLFGLAGGLVADRWPRHRLLLVTQSLLLAQAGTLAALTLSGTVTVRWILGLALLLGFISALDVPVRQTFVMDLVPRPDIPSAIGLNSSIFNASRLIGPTLAGLLVGFAGEGACFLINALSFLVILGCLMAMQVTQTVRSEQPSVMGLLTEGLTYVRRTRHVLALIVLVTVLGVASMPFSTLLPVFAGEVLHTGPHGLGLLMGATGIGALSAALRLARRGTVVGLVPSIATAAGLFGGGLLVLAASSISWLSLAALVAVGFGMVSTIAGGNTLLQAQAPEALRGRVASLYATVSLGSTIFGSLLAGTGATYFGAPLTVAAGGLITLLAAAVFWMTQRKARFRLWRKW